jgi:hypothetical protein
VLSGKALIGAAAGAFIGRAASGTGASPGWQRCFGRAPRG